MSRPAHARTAVMAAAEAIVKDMGAANLTYDELVRRSGITRGGITYHFPTKESLLEALVEHDLQRWRDCIAEKTAQFDGPQAALQGYIASGCEHDPDSARLCAGLLSVVSTSKALDQPWRAHYAAQLAEVQRSPDPALALLLVLAVEGLFWSETLDLMALPPDLRRQTVQRLLDLAAGMGGHAPAAQHASAFSGPEGQRT